MVEQFCDEFALAKANMQSYIISMAGSGVPFEQCQKFTNDYYKVDEDNFRDLYNNVMYNDLSRINEYAIHILREIESITGSGHESFNLVYPRTDINATKSAEVRSNDLQDYLVQCEAVCDFMDFITDMVQNLIRVVNDYTKSREKMLWKGVPRQVVDDYYSRCAPEDVKIVGRISDHLKEEYMILEKLYDKIVESLTSLNINSYRHPKKIIQF
ncbi:MAG: hypothetical protein J6Y98_08495 [Bacteroidales bacterium]|nr:hypothetical protein [Bacteroidales bacterium]